MKKTILILCLVAFIGSAFTTGNDPKPKTFTLNEEQANKLFQAIEISKKGLPSSTTVNALEASQSLQILQETQKLLSDQYQAQAKADSIANSKKKP